MTDFRFRDPRRPVATNIKSSLQEMIRTVRSPRSAFRALPDFMIIGAQKAGTTSLFQYLEECPDVRGPLTKEGHYYDHNVDRGEQWYRSNFPIRSARDKWITGESSPYYMLHPSVPRRLAEHLPGTRLIALLRHPVQRAYSHFNHSRVLGGEPIGDFEAAMAAEPARTDEAWARLVETGEREPAVEWFSYARRSYYAPQLRRWLACFPRESLLIMTAEELYADPKGGLSRARAHLGLPKMDVADLNYSPRNARSYVPISDQVRSQLSRNFVDDMAEVEQLMGHPTGWDLEK
jgi:hypothetical protein